MTRRQTADGLRVAPPRRLGLHRFLDAARPRLETRDALRRRERAVVEEMPLHVIGEAQPVFGARHQVLVHALRIRIGEIVDETSGPRPGLIRDP